MLDGNFKAEHQKMQKPGDDVPLSQGNGFMVGNEEYQAHLTIAKEHKEVSVIPHNEDLPDKTKRSTCHDHRAVNGANADRRHLTSTGIGAAACARHGCFYPHSVVDFQKGERYE